ncbi:MAG TPA: DEAD/DEAH box helicase family protein [Ktedonobacteraceae bacterium]
MNNPRDCQVEAITNLERSLAENRPRALIQMATGSGKTYTATNFIYRLLTWGGARRVLFLVDRDNLGRQTLNEFQQFAVPGDGRKFTEIYNVQRVMGRTIDPVARVCITNIQRLYSILSGMEEPDEEAESGSLFEQEEEENLPLKEPRRVFYNPAVPIEMFDVIVTDECHRSIYNLWRGVLEYFDAFIIGLTATPNKQTFGFFERNLVMEYGHERAVADGVNVDYLVYRIRTRITEQGSLIEKGYHLDFRDRQTREVRWSQEPLAQDKSYSANQLDRDVVSKDQMRTVIRTLRDALKTELFPGRTEVPKTLIFAKDDGHAEDLVQMVRAEFGRGNEFAQKITYKTTGRKPEELISEFRNNYYPRVAVTVDMISTGTDIKPLEVLLFMRAVKSQNFFEQMKGRGTRVISDQELSNVTPDRVSKTHFVLVDAVGMYDGEKVESEPPLERQPSVPFAKLLDDVALNKWRKDPKILPTLLSRLGRLNRRLQNKPAERAAIQQASGGLELRELIGGLVRALDPDEQLQAARQATGLHRPDESACQAAARELAREALRPFSQPELRKTLVNVQQRDEQIIDTISQDSVLAAGWDDQAREKERQTISSFRYYIEEHRDELTALQIFFSQPRHARLNEDHLRQLAEAIAAPPLGLTTDRLWQAYATLNPEHVQKRTKSLLTDLVTLVRYTMVYDTDDSAILEPYSAIVNRRFAAWLGEQEQRRGTPFSIEQQQWLELIRDAIARSLSIENDDFRYDTAFLERGGLGKAYQLFGPDLPRILQELNERLAA